MLLFRNKIGIPDLGHADGLLRASDRTLPASQAFIGDHFRQRTFRDSDGIKPTAFLAGPASGAKIDIDLGAIAAGITDGQPI